MRNKFIFSFLLVVSAFFFSLIPQVVTNQVFAVGEPCDVSNPTCNDPALTCVQDPSTGAYSCQPSGGSCSTEGLACNPDGANTCITGANCMNYVCNRSILNENSGTCGRRVNTPPPDTGTCRWSLGPPLEVLPQDNKCTSGYTPAIAGNPFAPNCVCRPIGDPNALPPALAPSAGPLSAPAPSAGPPPPAPCIEGLYDANKNGILEKNETTSDPKLIVKCTKVQTAIGPIETEPETFVRSIFRVILSLSGGLAIALIIYSGYVFMTSRGNPERIQHAREIITAAIVGLLFIILSLIILQFIGLDILKLPQFTGTRLMK